MTFRYCLGIMRTFPGPLARAGIPLTLLVTAVMFLLTTALVTAALPAAAVERPGIVGGDLLGARGVVVAKGATPLPPTTAAGWLVADLTTGDVLASKDPHGRFAPASTLKTLTAVTLIPRLKATARVTPTWADLNVDGSKVGLVQNVKYTVSELFTAMLVVSGNDAANTLATANGGIPKTVAEMNAEAAHLNALDTQAVNANGLDDPKQLTSAYDLALIARAGMQLPAFRKYVAIKSSHIRGPGRMAIPIGSHDKLLWNYPGAIGIKNGYTVKAQATFVGAATRGGHTLVVTLLRTNPRYWPEAAALLDWGFAATRAGISPIGQLVDPVMPTPSPTPNAGLHPAAVNLSASKDNGLPLLPTGVVGAGVAVIASSLLRGRRRSRRRKLRLPPL
ncbi:MAG: peptidase D-alanyl-D-alanine carboxypeptidase 1 [Frankiales bacterium]|nr:peptidase D-alanyl-D-alanine carboxypeptidase 1 [Frankiales bacterium]